MKYPKGARPRTVLAVLLLCAIPAFSQQETRQDRGKRVIEEALQACGGDAFRTLQDRTETGRIYSFDSGTGRVGRGVNVLIYTEYVPPVPGKYSVRIHQIFGKDQDEGGFLYTPDGAWDYTYRGARPLDKADFATYQDTGVRGIFYILRQRLDEPGISYYSQGGDIFEHIPVEIVDITDADGVTITVYFDRNTHLPLRQTRRRRNTQFNDFDVEVTAFAKYRTVKGVTLPLETRRERNGVKIFEMFLESEDVNKGLRDALFTLPANLKTLPKAK